MPENITVAAFILGAVMLLISVVGGKFKIFGAEISTMTGTIGRILAGVLGTILIGFGLYNSAAKLDSKEVSQAEESAKLSMEQAQHSSLKSLKATKSEALPAYFVLKKLTCINKQEWKWSKDKVYLKYNDSATDIWELNAGESVSVDLTIPAGTTISLWEKDLFMKDGDDDFLGEAKLEAHGGRLEFKNPSKGDHHYTLSYEPEN